LSTYPVAKGSYAVLSGTSMATPFLSGVAALFIGQNGKVDPDLIKKIFETTTTPVFTSMGGSELQTVAQQGGGLINAYDAVLFKTIISPSEFNLNDTQHAVTTGQITIENTGAAAVSYRISHAPAPAALTFGQVCPRSFEHLFVRCIHFY
jgi:subtilisin family serine protease